MRLTRGKSDRPRRQRRDALQIITVPRARCPRCGSHKILKYRSIEDQGDGSAMSWMHCDNPDCCARFRMVEE